MCNFEQHRFSLVACNGEFDVSDLPEWNVVDMADTEEPPAKRVAVAGAGDAVCCDIIIAKRVSAVL